MERIHERQALWKVVWRALLRSDRLAREAQAHRESARELRRLGEERRALSAYDPLEHGFL